MQLIHNKNFCKVTQLLATTCLGLVILAPLAFAAPTGGVVVGGKATISTKDRQTTIDQSTQKSAINWNSFDVAANETVEFKVPNGGGTLNRIIGGKVTNIAGTVKSNGNVFFINSNGFVFDSKSKLTVNDITITTADIKPETYIQGGIQLQFNPTNRSSGVYLNGTITTADRGIVAVFAPHIENQGTITAEHGYVQLSGVSINSPDKGNGPKGLYSREESVDVTVKNSGTINVAGGQIVLTTLSSTQTPDSQPITNFTSVIENSGTLNASNAKGRGGVVQLSTFGGQIIDKGQIDVSGNRGGGRVLIYSTTDKVDITGSIKAVGLSAKPCKDCISDGGYVVIFSKGKPNITGKVSVTSENGDKDGLLQINPTEITPPTE